MKLRNVPFSPPDMTEAEITEVANALRSGWITTGPRTKEFERLISMCCQTEKSVCLNSATACMELILRVLGVGPGDEVITSAYTYTASASVICHVGAKVVLVDTAPGTFEMDYDKLSQAITEKTKVIIPVDLGGVICDYDKIFAAIENYKHLFNPANDIQKAFGRIVVMADAAHAFGAQWHGRMCGEIADFTSFSFHAVKNLTTAEGGALTWRSISGIDNEWLYKQFQLLSLHGQNKDALAKTQLGAWEYDIIAPNFKCNMTDIMAGIGLAQLKRYPEMLHRRREIIGRYDEALKNSNVQVLNHRAPAGYGCGRTQRSYCQNGRTRNCLQRSLQTASDDDCLQGSRVRYYQLSECLQSIPQRSNASIAYPSHQRRCGIRHLKFCRYHFPIKLCTNISSSGCSI